MDENDQGQEAQDQTTDTTTTDGAQGGAQTDTPMSLDDLIAAATSAGTEKLDAIGKRGTKNTDKKETGPRKPTTAEAFADALKLVGEGNFVTVKSVTAIMEHQGWTSNSRSEREKYVAVKSAIYNRKRAGEENPKMALPIDWSKSRDGLFAYKPVVTQDEAEQADTGDDGSARSPEDIPTE